MTSQNNDLLPPGRNHRTSHARPARRERPVGVVVGRFGGVVDRGLRQILGGARGLRLLGAGLDHDGLEDAIARRRAQVVVLDEDSAATSALPRRLYDARPDVGLVVLAHRPTRAYATRVVAFGATACLSTDASAAEIVRSVRLAANGREVLISMSERPFSAVRMVGITELTRRERQVLNMLGRGRRNAEIAQELRISVETTRMHAKHIYRKLGVSSRGELLGVEV